MANRVGKHARLKLGTALVNMIHARQQGQEYVPLKGMRLRTNPIVPCPKLSEADVIEACGRWLSNHRIGWKRLNNGAGVITSQDSPVYNPDYYRTYGIIGGTDFIGIMPWGQFLGIEFKAGSGGYLTFEQQLFRDWVISHKGLWFVIHGTPELEHHITPILKEHDNEDDKFWRQEEG